LLQTGLKTNNHKALFDLSAILIRIIGLWTECDYFLFIIYNSFH